MRLGIDFGTTRVVVAAADRGRYPVVSFEMDDGGASEWYPSLCAVREGTLVSGHAAYDVIHDPSWNLARSVKRLLAAAGPQDFVLGMPVPELLTRFFGQLHQALRERSNLDLEHGEPLEVAIAVPAHASSNQRMLTADACSNAGFQVVRVLDEPSAAGLEYAWRRPKEVNVRRRHVAVYDLGGGTFDASVIRLNENWHEVITTEGIARLGGDDFDAILLDLALQSLGKRPPRNDADRDRMLEICREEKERCGTHTRRLKPDVQAGDPVPTVPMTTFTDALRPLIDNTLRALDTALERASTQAGADISLSTVVYQVGGASQLPIVGRILRERFKRRVWRSPYAHASVAIGLAIATSHEAGGGIHGRMARHFGVWREQDHGHTAYFDPVIPKDTWLPIDTPLLVTRRYRAVHNVAHYRYLECTRLHADGTPAGDVVPWQTICFPLRGKLQDTQLDTVEVTRMDDAEMDIEERYQFHPDGRIEVELVNHSEGYRRNYRLAARAA
jgi:molecular chaperone DnaK (HSP70)